MTVRRLTPFALLGLLAMGLCGGCKGKKGAPDAAAAPRARADARQAQVPPVVPSVDASLDTLAKEAVEDYIGGERYTVEDEQDGRERELSVTGWGSVRTADGKLILPVEFTDGESMVEMLFTLRRGAESLVVVGARIHKVDGVLRK